MKRTSPNKLKFEQNTITESNSKNVTDSKFNKVVLMKYPSSSSNYLFALGEIVLPKPIYDRMVEAADIFTHLLAVNVVVAGKITMIVVALTILVASEEPQTYQDLLENIDIVYLLQQMQLN